MLTLAGRSIGCANVLRLRYGHSRVFRNLGAMYRNTRLPRLCSGVRPSVSLRLASILRYLLFSPAVLYHFKHLNWTSTPSRFMAHIRILGNLQFIVFQDGEGLPAYQFITDDSSTSKFPRVGAWLAKKPLSQANRILTQHHIDVILPRFVYRSISSDQGSIL